MSFSPLHIYFGQRAWSEQNISSSGNLPHVMQEFHEQYPDKPGPPVQYDFFTRQKIEVVNRLRKSKEVEYLIQDEVLEYLKRIIQWTGK